jgi:Tfp pilus assembly protein PilF
MVHMNKKDLRKAFDRVVDQMNISPQNPYLYNILAGIYEAYRDTSNAENYFKKAIEMNPNVPALHVSLANFYMRQRMLDKAKTVYLKAVEKEPSSIGAHMALGMIYEGEKNYEKAKEHYLSVLKVNPNFAPAANNLAYIYAERGGNIDEALNLAQKAKEQVPDDPHVSDTLGWIYYKKNIPSRAIVYLKEANEKVQNQPMVKYHLGMAYYKNGNPDLAKKELEGALKLSADFEGANEARATLQAIK